MARAFGITALALVVFVWVSRTVQAVCPVPQSTVGFLGNSSASVSDGISTTCSDVDFFSQPGEFGSSCRIETPSGDAVAGSSMVITRQQNSVTVSGSATAVPAPGSTAQASVQVDVRVTAVGADIAYTYSSTSQVINAEGTLINTPSGGDGLIANGSTRVFPVICIVLNGPVGGTVNCSLTLTGTPPPPVTTFHWADPTGGSYSDPSNWDPNCDFPQQNGQRSDTAIFGLHTATPITISAANATAGRWEILESQIAFSGDATLSAASALPPSLAIGFGGRLDYQSGFLTTQNSVIGSGPPQSQLILGTGSTWFNLGTLRVGANGGAGGIELGENAFLSANGDAIIGGGSVADLSIHLGGVAQFQGGLSIGSIFGGGGIVTVSGTGPSRRSRLAVTGYTGVGNPLAPAGSPGFLIVTGGAEMELNGDLGVSHSVAGAASAAVSIDGVLPAATATVHGTILLGELGPGDMLIQGGATVDCDKLNLGSLISGANGELRMTGFGSGILVNQNVQVGGSGGHGLIDIDTGAFLSVTGNVTVGQIGGGELTLSSQSAATIGNGLTIGSFAGGAGAVVVSGFQTELDVTALTIVGVGPAISTGSLTVRNQAKADLHGNLHVDHFKPDPNDAAVFLASGGLLDVEGDIVLGVFGPADMLLTSAAAECTKLTVGGDIAGTSGLLVLEPQALMFVEDAQVGGSGGLGLVRIDSGAVLDVQGTMAVGSAQGGLVTVNGLITGAGLVVATQGGIINGTGHISVTKVENGGTIAPGLSPGTLTIEGEFQQLPSGRLEMEYAGTNPGEFDVLQVDGPVTLGGTLEVQFVGGFSPENPETFVLSQDFVEAVGELSGDYGQRTFVYPDEFADFDDDGDKDLRDVASFANCFAQSGALSVECKPADWERDGNIATREIWELGARLTGPE